MNVICHEISGGLIFPKLWLSCQLHDNSTEQFLELQLFLLPQGRWQLEGQSDHMKFFQEVVDHIRKRQGITRVLEVAYWTSPAN